jgi:Protein of unknown function (DUF3800)
MPKVVNFYIDDSGTRHPDHEPGKRAAHGYDWFSLGGILIRDEDEDRARQLYANFVVSWPINSPLHSSEIRGRTEGFHWLEDREKAERDRFYEELYQLIRDAPVVGLACVIDRPGYNHRYKERYANERWSLCKTAFNIAVERAAKYAHSLGYRLRVSPERCNKAEDRLIRGYYDDLIREGTPFAKDNSEKYGPLTSAQFREILYEFKPKFKSSPMVQLADLYLWPLCMGGYHASNRTYERLKQDGKLIDCLLDADDCPTLGTKYSCFDLVERKS